MFHYPFQAMGCQMRIVIDTPHDATESCTLVVDSIRHWEATLSRFDPASELNHLVDRVEQWQPVSPILWDVLRTADWAYRRSNGLIDPTIRAALEHQGYNTTYTAIGIPHAQSAVPTPGWQNVRIDDTQMRVWLPAGITLDLAGVAKSWAAQQALALLSEYPCAAIDAAGDISMKGVPSDGDAWPIGIEALPGFPEPGLLALTSHAIATSGVDKRTWRTSEGKTVHHIIDPRSGRPSTSDVLRASVIAPTLIEADIAARSLVILGHAQGFAWLAGQPGHDALVHTDSGLTHITPGWQRHLWEQT